ncbi:hypothetical protein EYZ11_009921 [Aspergillus tanneri]|uniref:Uncharacterized protein n=1 Tax=Aspergillus tanneri TaxID=1220188 RepID=A0A4S3J6P4_9EURO|nr:hypothetical protein EYZ11_009921 [Aspergillus tanneri]
MSRYSISSSAPYCLSEIINLCPEEERHCAGYAPSQKRRCHNPINAGNCRMASNLLSRGTERLSSRSSIDDLLENLAPLVLCWRHGNQADGLVDTWRRQVRDFQTTRTTRLESLDTAILKEEIIPNLRREVNQEIEELRDGIREELRRLQAHAAFSLPSQAADDNRCTKHAIEEVGRGPSTDVTEVHAK